MTMFEKLKAPFAPERISWRVGATNKPKDEKGNQLKPTKGLALAYIDARDVMDRLDEAVGADKWQSKSYGAGDGMLACEIGIFINDEWIWKGDGAGGREANKGLAEQDANKGNFSDAFKRAAVMWGIGRYLYDFESVWVEIDEYQKIKPTELTRLQKLIGGKVKYDEPEQSPQTLKDQVLKGLEHVNSLTSLQAWWTGNYPTINRLSSKDRAEIEAKKDELKIKFTQPEKEIA